MPTILRTAAVAALTAGLALAAAPAAYAADLECRGALGAVTVTGNLLIPDDSTCTLDGTTVLGAITVKSRATLVATGVEVTGGIQGESPASVTMSDSTLGNSVSLRKGGGADLRANEITGDVQLEENFGPIDLDANTIVGSVQANKNTGGVVLTNNEIGNGLQCQDNLPLPTGGNNTAKQKQGQCLNL